MTIPTECDNDHDNDYKQQTNDKQQTNKKQKQPTINRNNDHCNDHDKYHSVTEPYVTMIITMTITMTMTIRNDHIDVKLCLCYRQTGKVAITVKRRQNLCA